MALPLTYLNEDFATAPQLAPEQADRPPRAARVLDRLRQPGWLQGPHHVVDLAQLTQRGAHRRELRAELLQGRVGTSESQDPHRSQP